MQPATFTSPDPTYLGIEGGGTHTVALATGPPVVRREFGPGNLRLLSDAQLVAHFRAIARAMPRPVSVAIGMAGARSPADRARIRRAAAKVWPKALCYATNDLETALMAADADNAERPQRRPAMARVLVLSGTGSCCHGRTARGRTTKVGGWGHLLGDKGSGYEIGLRALKAVVYYFDRDGRWPRLGARLLRTLQLNEPDALVAWAQRSDKTGIAALAGEVFQAWADGDPIATDILDGAAHSLSSDAVTCAGRLARHSQAVEFILAGGVLLKQPRFADRVAREIKRLWAGAIVRPLQREGAWGAVVLARRQWEAQRDRRPNRAAAQGSGQIDHEKPALPPPASSRLSPTEERHSRSMHLDRLTTGAAVKLMLEEDRHVSAALMSERAKIERGIHLIVGSFRRGGRLFYVGAGTSGRLGVLDASECPPTFRTDPAMVQGIIAGGQTALWSAVEGAEDDAQAGADALRFRGVDGHDTVVGIAASGRTPFVWGALREARRRGATTILICFNPYLQIPRRDRPTLLIAPRLGPEILTGSTRLKAGTATKLILNTFTTLAMVRLGKVMGNLMIDVNASNTKLRERATRIVRELTGVDASTAQAALQKAGWRIKSACARLGRRR